MDSTVALVAGIVSAAAAVVAVVWAMIGNPDLRNVFGGWTQKRRLSVKEVERRVVRVDWHSIEAAAKTFLGANTVKYDLVVGLHPDGVSIASTIARRTDSRFATIEKVYPGMHRAPFFVFQDASHVRSKRESTLDFSPPSGVADSPTILVVDGVSTFGNALIQADAKLRESIPNARKIDFYVFAVDLPRLSSAHPDLIDRLSYGTSIDNHSTWLRFPWEDEP